ncbi:MAG: trypsin-like serine protease [Proteobacteria bacterium]|nr:trypsin-like serine protease [Pseudomonadota bacterium]NIS71336.1 trypsin-like serine protease [Pseudomonadota bacterium]
MVKGLQSLKQLILTSVAVVALIGLNGCVASKKEIHDLEEKTSEIQESLDRLRKEVEEGFRVVTKPDGIYDYNNSLFANGRLLNQVSNWIVTLETETLFETSQTLQPVMENSTGLGLIAGRFVITLDHVVTQNTLEMPTPFGRVSLPSKKLEEKTFLVYQNRKLFLKTVLRDPELDIALFEIPPNDLNLTSIPFPVGDSSELSLGTFVYIVGNPFNSGINVREGIVSSLLGMEGLEQMPTKRDDIFMISNGVVPGDSGAPALALRDGVPELVGIVQGTLGSSRIGWAVKINPIMRKISDHVDQEALHLVKKGKPLL